MDKGRGGKQPAAPAPGQSQDAKRAALAAALRANLQRRKTRERALRAADDAPQDQAPRSAPGQDPHPSDASASEIHEATWTK